MVEITTEQEKQSRDFVKAATLLAVHVHAVNEAIALNDMDLLKGSVEFGTEFSQKILAQVPEDIQMEVMLEVLAGAMGL
ncbi:hypothetical protein SEA_BELFORT_200 [Streptomyces phage Belfort]|uniref:Uncharacterized protein n=1 Tax=Streptomyces phage Belfort TaxID=2801887 RepID=A0A7T7Z9T4_9CAUD|nr:hypothetical protein SEA_BELFORT_200 [Streptomyces phage Belfort]